jgi:hypothetical protein
MEQSNGAVRIIDGDRMAEDFDRRLGNVLVVIGRTGLVGVTQFNNFSASAVTPTTPSLSPSFTDDLPPTPDGQCIITRAETAVATDPSNAL